VPSGPESSTRIDEPIAPVPASQATLRSARRLLRRKERGVAGRFLAEGRQAVAEALASGGAALEVLVADDAVHRHQDLLDAAARAKIPVASASARDIGALSDTVTPQGILAVCRTVNVALADALAGSPRLVVLCDQVRDPGNLGTVIRCADAFGADGVLISAESVDVYNAKTVRASTGSIFHLPLVVDVDLAEAVALGHAAGMAVFGADGTAEHTIDDLARSGALAGPIFWVLGNEAWGLPAEHLALIDRLVALPMYGRAESLNLSAAAAVLLYATASAQHTG
jgi:TrmH family RNA methyltransferase